MAYRTIVTCQRNPGIQAACELNIQIEFTTSNGIVLLTVDAFLLEKWNKRVKELQAFKKLQWNYEEWIEQKVPLPFFKEKRAS